MKIVKFKNGKYGLRKGNWITGYKFLSEAGDYWFQKENHVKGCCYFSLKRAKELLERLENPVPKMDYGRPLDEIEQEQEAFARGHW